MITQDLAVESLRDSAGARAAGGQGRETGCETEGAAGSSGGHPEYRGTRCRRETGGEDEMTDRHDEPSAEVPDSGDEPAAQSWLEPVPPELALPLKPQLLWKDRAGFDVVLVYLDKAQEDARVVPIESGPAANPDWLRQLSVEFLHKAPRIEWTEGHQGTIALTDVSRSFGINLLGPPPGPPTTPPPPWFRLQP